MAANQQFNLRWNNHTSNILQVFLEQLSNENLVDVTLSCEGQFIKAHKMVLSACSPYFQELFARHQVEHPVIILNGMKFCDVNMVVEFMYRGEIKVLESELNGLLAVAETLQIKGLSSVRNKYEKGQIQGTPATNLKAQDARSDRTVDISEEVTRDPLSLPQSNATSKKVESPRARRKRKRASDPPSADQSPQKSTRQSKSNSKAATISKPSEEHQQPNSNMISYVQVAMSEPLDDDFSPTIKVEPLYIRDIDEENEDDASWDPNKLVIDLNQSSEADDKTEPVKQQRPKASKKGQNIKTSFVMRPQVLKVRPTSELVATGTSQSASEDGVASQLNESESASESTSGTAEGPPAASKENIVGKERRGKFTKIPRPPNAFMIFANEWRRKIASENPTESNKDISVRLGVKWKNMSAEKKEFYYSASRLADEEHKRKYPNYYYSPKEARLRKTQAQALRQKVQFKNLARLQELKEHGKPLGSSTSDPMRFVQVYMTPGNSVLISPDVKKEALDPEEADQNLEEEFLKMVEDGDVEAEIDGETGHIASASDPLTDSGSDPLAADDGKSEDSK